MKVAISKNFKVELNTLIRLEWRKFHPVLIIHERYEKVIKYITWGLTAIGILSSMLAFDCKIYALLCSIVIFLIQLFFQKVIFEYTTVVVSPLPNFKYDPSEWLTNAFVFPQNENGSLNSSGTATFSMCFRTEGYAKQVFELFKQWNYEQDNDVENNIIISFVVENDQRYSTYIYQNHHRKNLDKLFSDEKKKNEVKKYGKLQQQFVVGYILGKKLPFRDGMLIKRFLEFQVQDKLFHFMPSVEISYQGRNVPRFLNSTMISKYKYKIKNRKDLTIKDFEYHFPIG